MKKRKITLVLLAIVLMLIIGGVFILFKQSPSKTSEKKIPEKQLFDFSQKFIKDYATYTYESPSEYNNRLKQYIYSGYLDSFSRKYFIGSNAKSNKALKGLQSNYISSSIDIRTNNTLESLVYIKYQTTKKGGHLKKPTITSTTATIEIREINNKLYITFFGFSVN